MDNANFKRYLQDIDDIPEDKLKDYASIIEKKIISSNDRASKASKQILLIIVAYFLLKNSIIDGVKVGPFNIKDIELIFNYIPLAIAYMMSNAAASYYAAFYQNFILSKILRRYYGLTERTLLLNRVLPMPTEHASHRANEKKKVSIIGCLLRLPLAFVFLSIGILIIPFYYYFVISTIIVFYNSGSELTIWTFWIPNVLALVYLLMALQHGVSVFKLIIHKTELYDEEDLRGKQKTLTQ